MNIDKVVIRNVVARAVLDTRLQNFEAHVEVRGPDVIHVVCHRTKDVARVEAALDQYRKEKLFKDIYLHATAVT